MVPTIQVEEAEGKETVETLPMIIKSLDDVRAPTTIHTDD